MRGGQTCAEGPVVRRRVWLYALATPLLVGAILLASSPAAQAEPDPVAESLALPDEESPDLAGRHPAIRYVILYEVRPAVEREDDCDSDMINPGLLGGIAGGLIGWGVEEAGCQNFSFDFVADLFWGLATDAAFNIVRILSMVGLWLVELVYSFRLVEWMDGPASELSEAMHRNYVGRLGLNDFAVFLAVAYSGFRLLTRKTARGLSELAISLLIAVLGATLVDNPTAILEGSLPYAIGTSGAMLQLATNPEGNPDGAIPDEVEGATTIEDGEYHHLVRPLTDRLHEAIVGQPYDLVNWGRVLEGTDCADAREAILADETIHAMEGGDRARQMMRDAGCGAEADFNARPSATRFAMAVLAIVVTMVIDLLLGVVSFGVAGAQFTLAGLVVILAVAWVIAILPGTGRQIGLRYLGTGLQACTVIVVGSFVLSMLLVITTELLAGDHELGLMERFVLLIIAVIMLFRFRKRLLTMTQDIVTHATEKLQTTDDESGFGANLLSPAAAGASFGIGKNLLDKAMGRAVSAKLPKKRAAAEADGGADAAGGGGGGGGGRGGGGAPARTSRGARMRRALLTATGKVGRVAGRGAVGLPGATARFAGTTVGHAAGMKHQFKPTMKAIGNWASPLRRTRAGAHMVSYGTQRGLALTGQATGRVHDAMGDYFNARLAEGKGRFHGARNSRTLIRRLEAGSQQPWQPKQRPEPWRPPSPESTRRAEAVRRVREGDRRLLEAEFKPMPRPRNMSRKEWMDFRVGIDEASRRASVRRPRFGGPSSPWPRPAPPPEPPTPPEPPGQSGDRPSGT